MRLSDYEVDPEKLDGGVWWNYATMSTCPGNVPTPGAGCFLIVPMVANFAFQALLSEGNAVHAGTLNDSATPEETKRSLRQSIWARAAAKAILKGWAGWDDLPDYTEEQAAQLLTERRYAAVAEFILNASSNQRAALLREEEQAKGN